MPDTRPTIEAGSGADRAVRPGASAARSGFEREIEVELARLEGAGLRRRLRLPSGVDLVSNDYLGFAGHPDIIAALASAAPRHGAGAGGSRLLRGNHAIFEACEEGLARLSGQPGALLFSSGWAANVGLLQAVVGPEDFVVSDALNHASLVDGLRLSGARKAIYPHQDLDAARRALRGAPAARRRVIVVESVYSMDGDLTPLEDLVALAEDEGALVVVDEAHATGLYGGRGSGRVEALGLGDRVLASIHTGGKALGLAGAWVAGSTALISLLLHRARSFVFSTAPLPVLPAGLMAAVDLLALERSRADEVLARARLFRGWLGAEGIAVPSDDSPIVPVVVGGNERAVQVERALGEAGFDARAVRPPTVPAGTARLRLTVRYPVSEEVLRSFTRVLGELLRLEPGR